MSGAGRIPTCFSAGTPVTMADGAVRTIETIGVGDRVLAYDGSAARVSQVDVQTVERVRDLRFRTTTGGRRLATTDGHLFWRADGLWVAAADLAPGDAVLLEGRNVAEVLTNTTRTQLTTVYNLVVDGVESYFANGVLVRQGCDGRSDPVLDERMRDFLRAEAPPPPAGPRVGSGRASTSIDRGEVAR